ncbi:MAG: M3 family metallopeptidase [Chloroflexota bacterium]
MSSNNNNPLLDWDERPPFDLIKTEHITPGVETMLAESKAALEMLENANPSSWDELVPPLEAIIDKFSRVWNVVSHLNSVKNSPELREVYAKVQPQVVTFSNRLSQSRPIYDAFCRLGDSEEWDSFNPAQQRIIEKSIQSAMLAGVGLDGEEKERFNSISESLAKLQTTFSNNVLDSTKAFKHLVENKEELAGLPTSFLEMGAQAAVNHGHEGATGENGPWLITLDIPSYMPTMKNCSNRELRKKLYMAYVQRAANGEQQNHENADQILALKQEKAQLLGYKNHAEMSVGSKMASTIEAVDTLLSDLKNAATPTGIKDLDEIKALAAEHGAPEGSDMQQWDVYYWGERLREAKFDINEEELRAYFPFERVLDGMFGLVKDIFDIHVVPADGEVAVWHPDVRYFRVQNDEGNDIAAFYLDPYTRPAEKRGGAWANAPVQRTASLPSSNGDVRIPVAYMCCNQSAPVGETPSLMTLREVETLFHEFGHDLQHMLTQIDYGLCSGLAMIEWDAIEIASQFMENWIYHKPTLQNLSGHYQTGASLPEETIDKIIAARSFRSGYAMLRQINFGRFDMELYADRKIEDETVKNVQERIFKDTMILSPVPDDMSYCSFNHIFPGGYSAGYYSYKWSEVLSADAFAAFTEVGLENKEAVKEVGMRYRNTILGMGGSRHPMEVYKEFRGREPSIEPLLKQEGLI